MANHNRDGAQPDDDQVFGVAWYSETEWAKLVAVAAILRSLKVSTPPEYCAHYAARKLDTA